MLAPYRPQEAAAILDGLRGSRDIGGRFDLAVLTLLAETGVQRRELVRLLTADLDLKRATLQVRSERNGSRLVPLSDRTVEELGEYLGEVRPVCPPSDLLFANPRVSFDSGGYGSLEPHLAGDLVRRAGRSSGVAGPHTCQRWRTTAAVELLRAGVDVEEVCRRLGHVKPKTTRRYRHKLDAGDYGS
jgi:integrase